MKKSKKDELEMAVLFENQQRYQSEFDKKWRREYLWYSLRHPWVEDSMFRVIIEDQISAFRCWFLGGHDWEEMHEDYEYSYRMCRRPWCNAFEFMNEDS